MKSIIFILICIQMLGCSLNRSKALESETEQSIRSFAIIGKTTNCDILRKMKKPSYVQRNDDGYIYHYHTFKIQPPNPFSNTYINNIDMKSASFTFKNNILQQFYFADEDRKLKEKPNKYRYVTLPLKPEINVMSMSEEDFMDKIRPGMKKGKVFRVIGKPFYVNEDNGKEIWTITRHDIHHTYNIVFVDDIVVERGRKSVDKSFLPMPSADLTDEEKQCINMGL